MAWFLRAYVPLALLGCLSLLGLVPVLAPALAALRLRPELAGLSPLQLHALVLAQPAAVMLALTALGAALAGRTGLRSVIADAARGEPVRLAPAGWTIGLAAATVAAALLVLAADQAFSRILPAAFAGVPPATDVPLAARVGALFYGGVVEELMLRLGVMTALVALGRRLFPAAPPGRIAWAAIALAAVLFGLLHVPALAGVAPLTAPLVARTVILNAALGLLFGYAYWRYALEYAMLSHALVHVTFGVVGALGRVSAL